MAAAGSQQVTSITAIPSGLRPSREASNYMSGTDTIGNGVATCTIANVGPLTDHSLVRVYPLAAGKGLIEIFASRTLGNQGTITIGTIDGGNTPGVRAFFWERINL